MMHFDSAAQLTEQPIGATPPPILTSQRRTRRFERETVPIDPARPDKLGTLARQPIDCARRIRGNRRSKLGIGLAVRLPIDRRQQLSRAQLHVVV